LSSNTAKQRHSDECAVHECASDFAKNRGDGAASSSVFPSIQGVDSTYHPGINRIPACPPSRKNSSRSIRPRAEWCSTPYRETYDKSASTRRRPPQKTYPAAHAAPANQHLPSDFENKTVALSVSSESRFAEIPKRHFAALGKRPLRPGTLVSPCMIRLTIWYGHQKPRMKSFSSGISLGENTTVFALPPHDFHQYGAPPARNQSTNVRRSFVSNYSSLRAKPARSSCVGPLTYS